MTGRKAGLALDFVLQEGRALRFGKANCTEGPKGKSVLRQCVKDKTEESQAAFPKSSSLCAENDCRKSTYPCTSGNVVGEEGLSAFLGIWLILCFTLCFCVAIGK